MQGMLGVEGILDFDMEGSLCVRTEGVGTPP